MAYYEELNNILRSVTETNIIGNPKLRKLVYYYPSVVDVNYDPLLDENGIARPDIPSSEIYMKYIYPMPKLPDKEAKQKCFIACNLGAGEYIEGGKWRNIYLVFDIICHLDAWLIKEGYRVYTIASEIDKTFNYQNPSSANIVSPSQDYYSLLDLPSFQKIKAIPFTTWNYSYSYYGIQLKYELTVNSNVACG